VVKFVSLGESMTRLAVVLGFFVTFISAFTGCNRQRRPEPSATDPVYTPGLGEIMGLTQMRHAKLWFAGQAGNWPLASYEVDELKEGLEDAVLFHPAHKDSPLPIPDLIDKIMTVPVKNIGEAVTAKDSKKFTEAFDDLTAACNQCHMAANFGFNVVTRPTANPYTNQNFQPAHPAN
jgi:hypothetical protein